MAGKTAQTPRELERPEKEVTKEKNWRRLVTRLTLKLRPMMMKTFSVTE